MEERNFTDLEEKSIIALTFDEPEFISSIINKLETEFFQLTECQFIFAIIKMHYNKNGVIPTRNLTKDIASKHLTVDDPGYEDVLDLCDYKIDIRDYNTIKTNLLRWLQKKAYGKIFSEYAVLAYETGDYDKLSGIIDDASRIQDIGSNGYWFFSPDGQNLLFNEEAEIKLTTGFPQLDAYLNEGGPTAGECMLWLAPTGVGKSIAIVNTAAACYKRGLNILHITLELSILKTAIRYCGVFSKCPIKERLQKESTVRAILNKVRETCYNKEKDKYPDLVIYEFPPNEITIENILAIVENLKRTRGWIPDVIAVDYLELMCSKNVHFNKEEYLRQKQISVELRQLAKKTGCFVISASQTNRSKGDSEAIIGLDRVSESYSKLFAVDYCVSMNQTVEEYNNDIPKLRFYIAKNRNGPKNKTVSVVVNYNTMIMMEESPR